MRFAVVDNNTRRVINVIEAPENWTVEAGLTLVATDEHNIDDTWDGQQLIKAPSLSLEDEAAGL